MGRPGKSSFLIWAEYLGALPFLLLCKVSPLWFILGVSRLLGWLAYLINRTGRKVAMINLGIAFKGSLSKRQARRITRNAFISFGMTLGELTYFLNRPGDALVKRTDCSRPEIFETALRRGQGVIVCSAHFSNWYWPVMYGASLGLPQNVVVRPLDNPKLDRWMNRILERRGIKPLPRKRSVRPVIAALQRGETLGLMVDQNAAVGGRFVSFFGTSASTMRGVAVFRRLTGAEVICVHHLRERGSGRHRIVVSGPFELPDDEGSALQCINDHFEEVIREHPDLYLWIHPRWKRRPGCEATLYPGLRI